MCPAVGHHTASIPWLEACRPTGSRLPVKEPLDLEKTWELVPDETDNGSTPGLMYCFMITEYGSNDKLVSGGLLTQSMTLK